MTDQSIQALVSRLRDLINQHRIQSNLFESNADWLMLCSSLDVVEDSQLAIVAFKDKEFSTNLMDGSGYLMIYGLLQSLFLQQDAIIYIHKALGIGYSLQKSLKDIRELRNDTIGHPMNRNNGKLFCFIDRTSITNKGFVYHKHRPDGSNFDCIEVDIQHLLTTQYSKIKESLQIIIKQVVEREQKHRNMYKDCKMDKLLSDTIDWEIGKIREAIDNPMLHKTALSFLGQIDTNFKNIELELEARKELSPDHWYFGFHHEIEYPINQLKEFFQESDDCEINSRLAPIIVYYIKGKLKELKSYLAEIDDEYNTPFGKPAFESIKAIVTEFVD